MTKRLLKEQSFAYDRRILDYIQHAAATGLYEIRGLGAKRALPTFDDLVFLAASISRYPLEGYREKCSTKTILGTRYAKKPVEFDIPITVAGMSFGSLSARVKEAVGMAARELGTSTTTGDGGMTEEEHRRRVVIPIGPAPTISPSRSTSCANSPIGRFPFTSRSAPRGCSTT